MTVKNVVMDVIPAAPAKGADIGTTNITGDGGFAARLDQVANPQEAGKPREVKPQKPVDETAGEQAETVKIEEEPEENTQAPAQGAVMAAIPIIVNEEQPPQMQTEPTIAVGEADVTVQTMPMEPAAQEAETMPVMQDAEVLQGREKTEQPVKAQSQTVPMADVESKPVEANVPQQTVQEEAPAKEQQAAITIDGDVDADTLDFVKQAMNETEAVLNQPAKARVDTNTQADEVAPQDMPEAQATKEAKVVAQTDEKSQDMGNKPKETQTQAQPVTANIAQDGKVEFKMTAAQPLEAEQALPREPVETQIVSQVRTMVSAGRSELTIQLKPDHLGGLSIVLAATEGKGLVAKLVTSNEDVRNMLQADMTQMQQELRDKGINVVEMEVIYNQMTDTAGKQDSNNGQTWSGSAPGSQGRVPENTEAVRMNTYDEMSTYEVLAEQGGSVEFSA